MTVDDTLVRTWQGEPLAAQAHRMARAGERLRAELTALLAADPEGTTWRGQGAAAASRHRADGLDQLVLLLDTLAAVEEALTLAAVRVQAAGDTARAAARQAELQAVLATGSDHVEALVDHASTEAARADADLTGALAAAARRLVVTGTPHALGGAAAAATTSFTSGTAGPPTDVPPVGATAATVLAWWTGLSAEGRRAAVIAVPDLVGSTDGIPAWARDQANRTRLVRAEGDLTLETARLRPPPDGGWFDVAGGLAGAATVGTLPGPSRRAAYLEARSKLMAVEEVATVLRQTDGRQRQLLVLDASGRSVKAAVAVGDVDGADHLAIVVPGFTTTVQGDLAGADALASDLRDVARRESMAWGDRGEVAVVSWLGYDAPQVADTLGAHSVVARASAEAGAAELNPFLRGLPDQAHLTVVGHSYGSTTAGLAVAAGGSRVDDLVVIGSPGLGVDSAGALGLPAEHVHVIEADDDPVADLGWFGRDPGHLAGVDLPSADARPLTDGSTGLASRGHSQYLTHGTTSQWNIAAVAVGVATVPTAVPRERRVG